MKSKSRLTELLLSLSDEGIEFILVGGMAAVIQGVPSTTFDVDIVHARSASNIDRILRFLKSVDARQRGRSEGPAVLPSKSHLSGVGHVLLQTRLGSLDLLGAIEGGRDYEALLSSTSEMMVSGRTLRVLSLEVLLELKQGSRNAKDKLKCLQIKSVLKRKER